MVVSEKKPNIVLITIDSLRADIVDCFLGGQKRTPFLNSLAKKSYVFTNAIVPSLPTYFAFPSIMTGEVLFKFGNFLGIQDKAKTITEVLYKNNYNTYAFIADNPFLYQEYGYDKLFNHFVNKNDSIISNKEIGVAVYKYKQDLSSFSSISLFLSLYRTLIAPKISVSGEKINFEAKKVLTCKKKSTKPFFLWLHYMDVHSPYYSGFKHFKQSKSWLKNLEAKRIFYQKIARAQKEKIVKDKDLLLIIKEMYFASVEYIDHIVREIIDFISHKFSNTIFIITSDHGEAFMEHDFYHHAPVGLYNELLKAPLLIKFPGSKKSTKINSVASLLSIPKTICDVLNITNSFNGSNLINIKAKTSELDKISLILYDAFDLLVKYGIFDNKTEIKGFEKMACYYDDNWKYIFNNTDKKELLFNIKKDSNETNDLSKTNKNKCNFYYKKLAKYL